jgi:hypothetical protein
MEVIMARVIEEREVPVAAEPAAVGYNPLVRIVYAAAAVIESLLIARLLLRWLGANPLNGFVNFIYSLSRPLVAPFFGALGTSGITEALNAARFEVPTIFAIVVYALAAWVLSMLFGVFTRRY